MKKTICLLASFLFLGFVPAQVNTRSYVIDPQLAPREHPVDFKHMKLEVSFDPAKGLVKGKVTHTFVPLLPKVDSICLDATDLLIQAVLLNGKAVRYRSSKREL